MKTTFKNFINGILTIVPILLVIYVIVKIFTFLDGILGNVLRPYLKESYIPGIGLLLTILLITLFGWLSSRFLLGTFIKFIEHILNKIPFVKTVYSVIKDTIHSFLGEKKSFSKVVLITHANSEMKSVGFITSDDLSHFYEPLSDHVAVYLPQTFQVAGFTVLVPRDSIEILDVQPEEAMKFILSGGMTSK